MLEVGTVFTRPGDTHRWKIVHVTSSGYIAYDEKAPDYVEFFPTEGVYDSSGTIAPYNVISRPSVTASAGVSSHGFDRAMAMSYNIGNMESTIESLWYKVSSMENLLPTNGADAAYQQIDRMRQTIIRCAERLRPLPNVNGTQTIHHLATFVADHK